MFKKETFLAGWRNAKLRNVLIQQNANDFISDFAAILFQWFLSYLSFTVNRLYRTKISPAPSMNNWTPGDMRRMEFLFPKG